LEALTLEQRIRTRADELWKQDGSLQGCADEYWRQAQQLAELKVAKESAATWDGHVAKHSKSTSSSYPALQARLALLGSVIARTRRHM
jgi:hypothetical protein